MNNKVLVIGWSSAHWDIIDPLIKDGLLPNLSNLKKESTYCSLSSPDPSLNTSNWTSILTGCPSSLHGIVRRVNINKDELLPLSTYDVQRNNIFEIAANEGLKCIQIGAPLSHPIRHNNKLLGVSEYVEYSDESTISESLDVKKINKVKNISDEIILSKMELFFGAKDLQIIKSNYPSKFTVVKDFIRNSLLITGIFEQTTQNNDWSLSSLFYHKLDELLFNFIPYLPEINTDKSNIDFEFFKDVIKGAFQLLDQLLNRIVKSCDSNTTLFLLSQSAYKPNLNWISEYKKSIDSCEYSEHGILLMNGKYHKARKIHFDATILDVVPTIAALLHIPQSKEWMSAKIFLENKNMPPNNKVMESYEKKSDNSQVLNFPNSILQVFKRNINKIYKPSDFQLSNIIELQEYFNARSLIASGENERPIQILEKLWKKNKYNSWYGARLIGAYINNNMIDQASLMIGDVIDIGEKIPELHLIRANLLMAQKKYRTAATHLEIAGENKSKLEGIFVQIASCYAGMNFPKLADTYFQKEIELSDHPKNLFGYGSFLMEQKRINAALSCFKKVVDQIPMHPMANFYFGSLLYQTAKYQQSAEVLELVKTLDTNEQVGQNTHNILVDIYKNKLNRTDKIEEMRQAYEKSIGSLGEIIIVSGLPRSGTSMMMQMLLEGGIEVFTDGKRSADENNKKGYLEHEAVKNLAKEKKFLFHAKNKAVKVISHLLKHLPHVFKYKVIFMDREIHEVMDSQSRMLQRLGNEKQQSDKLLENFEKSRRESIDWCKTNKNYVDLLVVSYNDILARPIQFTNQVNQFLGDTLDVRAMTAVVDKSLYREKHSDGSKNR